MNFFSKYTLYDWHGSNQELFKTINHAYASRAYDSGMLFLHYLFDPDNYPYFMVVLGLYAGITTLIRWARGQDDGKGRPYMARWIGVLSVLVLGFVVMALAIKTIKADIAYPRPYIALASDDVRLLDKHMEVRDDNRSFPSGHMALITLLVVGLWPVLSRDMKVLGVLLIPVIGWSRIAVGVHFPADILGGFLITLIIVLFVRRFVYWLLETLFGLEC